MFCPECKSMMFPKDGELSCRKCGYTGKSKSKASTKIVTERTEDKEMMVIDGSIDTLPKTRVECPKCGHNEAFFVLRQTRASDEPETRIYRCCKCSASWREY
ncbi:MAG: transcription factor S [Thermoplasmata archaeon]|nr:transcription factor S [Thermoplasmata archaeon]